MRMPSSRLLAAVFAVAAIAAPPVGHAAAPTGRDVLYALERQHYADVWKLDPVAATDVGVHTYDGDLGSYGAADYATRIENDKATLRGLAAFSNTGWPLDDLADKIILQNALKRELWNMETRRRWSTDPRIYSGIASDGIYGIMERDYAPLAQRLQYVISRENQIPRVLSQGQANIVPANVDPTTAQIALLDTAGAIDFFETDVPLAFAGVHDPALQSQFLASNAAAVAALKNYEQYIKTSVVPNAHGSYAIGATAYQYLEDLQNATHVPLTRLESVGEAALKHDKAFFIRTAAAIDPKSSPEAVFLAMSKDHPSGDQLIPAAQTELNDLVAFIRARGIIDLPDAPVAKVIATPKFEAQLSFASMDSPGPLETQATEAYYRVTPVDPTWTAKQTEEHLAFFNRYSLALVSLHEAYPGHYTNYLFNKRSNLSLVRKLNWNVAFGEGWAHYDEQMMVDEGLGNGDPRYRLAQLALALQRECRFLVGIREHTAGMTVDQATQFFMDNAFMGREPSHREALRGTQDPLYGYYTLGKLMLLKLRADDRAKLGARFSLRRFHDQVLSHGDPPIYFLRKMILGPNDKGSLL